MRAIVFLAFPSDGFQYFCVNLAHQILANPRKMQMSEWFNHERFLIRSTSFPLPTRQSLFKNNPCCVIKTSLNFVLMEMDHTPRA